MTPMNRKQMTPAKADSVNYSNIDEVEGYQQLLCKLYELEGGFHYPPRVTPALKAIETELGYWLKEVKALIMEAPVKDVYRLLNAYDLPFRMVHHKAPDGKFLRKMRLNAVQRCLKGERVVTSTEIARLIAQEIDRDYPTLDDRYSSYYFSLIGEWCGQLTRYGEFHGIPLREAYQRLALIMDEDLYIYMEPGVNEKALKSAWVNRYYTDTLALLDTPTLRDYISFMRRVTASGCYTPLDKETEYRRQLTELASRPDTAPYLRQAITLDLTRLKHPMVG